MSNASTAPALELTHFSFEVDADGVATILMDVQGDKVNTLSAKVESDLRQIIERLESDDRIVAAVIGSKKQDNFLAGADIEAFKEITQAEEATKLIRRVQEGFSRLEALHQRYQKPVVAAVHGACLGGGLELALACSMRIASNSNKTVLGFPEVMIGLFPAAGGTQRAPRLVGLTTGLDLILTGRRLRPKKAKGIGLVDEVVPEAILLTVAKRRALETARGTVKPPKRGLLRLQEIAQGAPERLKELALAENPAGQRLVFKKAKETLLKKSRGNYPGPERALEAVRIGLQDGMEAGFLAEAQKFGELVVSDQAQGLISIFFAQQELKKENGTDNPRAEVRPIKKLGLLGGGLMGGGIAAVTATKMRIPVRVKDIDHAGLGRCYAYVRKILDRDRQKKRRSRQEVERLMSLLTGTLDMSGLESADVVIEAVFEDLELKRRLVQETEAVCRPDTIFASNTSSLPIKGIAEASSRPENIIGMHYFSPVEKMPLLEVVVTKDTADWVTATCVQIGKDQGKTVIVVRDGTGFYTSRILAPYMNEAAWVIYEGGDARQLDEVMMDWGFPVGPITLLDEVGIDVAAKVAGIMQRAYGERLASPGTMDTLLKDNRFGRKNGRGFYRYEDGKKGDFDDGVYKVFGQSPKRRLLPAEELQTRLGLQFVNEALLCLQEEVLRSPRDGDIGAIFGLGFPPFTGGPFAYVDRVGAAAVLDKLENLAARHGERFTPASILQDYAKSGKKFRPEIG